MDNRKDYFDKDFEVTYEDDYSEVLQNNTSRNLDNGQRNMRHSSQDQIYQRPLDTYADNSTRHRSPQRTSSRHTATSAKAPKSTGRAKKKSPGLSRLAAPAKKTVQTGAKATGKIIQTVCKTASLILMAVITVLLTYKLWINHSTYGNPASIISERNYALGAYLGVSAFLLLFEIISFLWALSGPRAYDRRGKSFKTDTGRGMFSFILIACGSFLSSIFFSLIPDSPAAVAGIKGALLVYGSLFQVLFRLCIAGIISCILRKFTSR